MEIYLSNGIYNPELFFEIFCGVYLFTVGMFFKVNKFALTYFLHRGWFMVFNATFNNISVIYRGGQFYFWRSLCVCFDYIKKGTVVVVIVW
jgi:hypothetical protein